MRIWGLGIYDSHALPMLVQKMENLKGGALGLPPADQGKLRSGKDTVSNPIDPDADPG